MPRRFPRILMTDSTTIVLPGERREPVKITNLSAGGARLRTPFPLPIGERVTLHMPLGVGIRQDVQAHVVYCQRDPNALHFFGGLSFVAADRDGVPEIAAYIEEEQRRRLGARHTWRD